MQEVWDAFEDSKDDVRFLLEWIARNEDRETWKKAIRELNDYRATKRT